MYYKRLDRCFIDVTFLSKPIDNSFMIPLILLLIKLLRRAGRFAITARLLPQT
jgi:hypothetical protein